MSFTKNLNAYLTNPKNRNAPLDVGDTPNALLAIGAAQLPVVMNVGDIDKCLAIKTGAKNKNQHELTVAELNSLPKILSNPVMIFKDPKNENYITIITDKFDKQGRPFVVGVELNASVHNHIVNRIATMHGRDHAFNPFIAKNGAEVQGFIPRNISDGNLMAINIKKAPDYFRSAGLQLPEGKEIVSFDNSIAQNLNSVKSFEENIFGNLEENFSEEDFVENMEDEPPSLGIFQLKDIPETDNIRYQPSKVLDRLGAEVNPENYDCVHVEKITDEYAGISESEVLEDVFERFNGGFGRESEREEVDTFGTGTRSMSVSDVVVLSANGRHSAHYCDQEGFKELPENVSKSFHELQQQHEIDFAQEEDFEIDD